MDACILLSGRRLCGNPVPLRRIRRRGTIQGTGAYWSMCGVPVCSRRGQSAASATPNWLRQCRSSTHRKARKLLQHAAAVRSRIPQEGSVSVHEGEPFEPLWRSQCVTESGASSAGSHAGFELAPRKVSRHAVFSHAGLLRPVESRRRAPLAGLRGAPR